MRIDVDSYQYEVNTGVVVLVKVKSRGKSVRKFFLVSPGMSFDDVIIGEISPEKAFCLVVENEN